MDKKAITVVSSDWHIKPSNVNDIRDLVIQKINLAKSLGVNILICLGDVFQSRQAQPLQVLKCFENILNDIHESGMMLYCIPGNHDKTDYSVEDSFLDSFNWHPALKLIRDYRLVSIKDTSLGFYFLPFFNEEIWVDKLLHPPYGLINKSGNILFSHQAMSGSVNNDGSKVENKINPSMFSAFDKVFLGHYHNKQQVSDNIFHIPSICSHNFGEDNDKGFTVVYDDSSFDIVNSKFSENHTIDIDLDRLAVGDISKLKDELGQIIDGGHNVRLRVLGEESKVISFNKEEFENIGVSVQKEHKSIDRSIKVAESGDIDVFTDQKIFDKFMEFCRVEGFDDLEYGVKCLKENLNL